ncbi:MAG: DUF4760 domain-containing protein [Anaerolineales bacterium]|nr:DUF4760 domain-containing protein [Anaerolineales bacterium]
MNLQTFSVIVDIIGSLAVFAAIIFGLIQIKHFHRQRRDLAAIELVRSVQDSEFTKAYRLIHSLPEKVSASEFSAKGTEYVDAAHTLGMKYETIGLLVFRGVVPISAAEELVGGIAITLWKRLGPWVDSIRKEQSQELFLEWFQWFVNRLEERNRDLQEPAYKRYYDWQQ